MHNFITNCSQKLISGATSRHHTGRCMLLWFTILIAFNSLVVTPGYGSSFDSLEESNDAGETQWSSDPFIQNKRAWDKLQAAWGKRGWQNLHSTGWGKRAVMNDDPLSPYYLIAVPSYAVSKSMSNPEYSSAMDKRAWQNLHAGWGKRSKYVSGGDDYTDNYESGSDKKAAVPIPIKFSI